MKVLRWQEASLESSKGFYKGSRLSLTVVRFHARKSMKMHENPLKSMKSPRSAPTTPTAPPDQLWSTESTALAGTVSKRTWPAELTKQSNFTRWFNQSGFPHLLSHRCCWIVRWCWLSCWEYWPPGRYAIPHCETVAFYWWHYPIVSQRQVFQ